MRIIVNVIINKTMKQKVLYWMLYYGYQQTVQSADNGPHSVLSAPEPQQKTHFHRANVLHLRPFYSRQPTEPQIRHT
jgi:hypothetical protein